MYKSRLIIRNDKLINENKIKLNNNICENMVNINILNKEHIKFLNFTKKVKICEYYKWNNYKHTYLLLKKKNSNINTNYKQIIKLYGNIIFYYNSDEIININEQIKHIYNLIKKMKFEFQSLKYNHCITRVLIHKSHILKIYNTNNIMDSIYDTYYKLINIINEIKIVKKFINKQKLYLETITSIKN